MELQVRAYRFIIAARPRRLARLRALAWPHPGLWGLFTAVAGLDCVWIRETPLSLDPESVFTWAAVVAALFGAAAYWTLKPVPRLRALALSTAFLLTLTSTVGVLHYLAATLARPLVDARLAAVEKALGFDWLRHIAFLDSHAWLAAGLALAYFASVPLTAVVVLALSLRRNFARLRAFLALYAATLLVVVAFNAAFPAEGAYAFHAPPAALTRHVVTTGGTLHLADFEALRTGTPLRVALEDIKGYATFPSFHVCLAVLAAWALRPVPLLRVPAALFAAAMIVSTLGIGGHYLPDLLGGGALAGAALAVRRRGRGGLAAGQARAAAQAVPAE